jgi:hypothetical protein
MPTCAKATPAPTRTVWRRFSEASAITASAFHPFAGLFHCMVVPGSQCRLADALPA